MYRITKGIHAHFAHVVYGHSGLCLGPHGHTWYFELTLEGESLDEEGFVCDFSTVKRKVLTPVEKALDHAFAIGSTLYPQVAADLKHMGEKLLATRVRVHGLVEAGLMQEANIEKSAFLELPQVEINFLGSCKMCVFDFNPTSERLAKWLFELAEDRINTEGVVVSSARVYETLQPVQSFAEYRKSAG